MHFLAFFQFKCLSSVILKKVKGFQNAKKHTPTIYEQNFSITAIVQGSEGDEECTSFTKQLLLVTLGYFVIHLQELEIVMCDGPQTDVRIGTQMCILK